MSDVLSFAEIEVQQVELLPARTVLSMLRTGSGSSVSGQNGTATATATATVPSSAAMPSSAGLTGGPGGQGGAGTGIAGFWHNWIYIEGDMNNKLVGAEGGDADGGATYTATAGS